jgi:hypothetical protein
MQSAFLSALSKRFTSKLMAGLTKRRPAELENTGD